jgi:redox-sensing transcriptional repressor
MKTMKTSVPKATLQRFPIYLKALRKLGHLGITRIMSKELSDFVGIEPTTIRRDFSFLGSLGKQGYGYDVAHVIKIFEDHLGAQFEEKIILVGVGNLGKALMNYNRWDHVVGEITCAFDIDASKIGNTYQVPVYPLTELKERMPQGCKIAILTVSTDVQETVDQLIELGVTGIVDFTHEHIQVPRHVTIKYVDVVSMIQELIFQIHNID